MCLSVSQSGAGTGALLLTKRIYVSVFNFVLNEIDCCCCWTQCIQRNVIHTYVFVVGEIMEAFRLSENKRTHNTNCFDSLKEIVSRLRLRDRFI